MVLFEAGVCTVVRNLSDNEGDGLLYMDFVPT